jgi:hypothetical protein
VEQATAKKCLVTAYQRRLLVRTLSTVTFAADRFSMRSSNELKPCAIVPEVGSVGVELLSVDMLAKYVF